MLFDKCQSLSCLSLDDYDILLSKRILWKSYPSALITESDTIFLNFNNYFYNYNSDSSGKLAPVFLIYNVYRFGLFQFNVDSGINCSGYYCIVL